MSEKEEETVKSKSDVAYDYHKSRFEAENEIKEGFYQKTSFLIIAMTLVASFAFYFLRAYFIWDLWGLTCCALVAAGAVLFIKAFWHVYKMTYECKMKTMPDAMKIRDYEKSISSEDFDKYLIDKMAEATSLNAETNIRRGQHFYKAEMSLLFSFVFFAAFAIVGFSMSSDEKDKPTTPQPPPDGQIIKTGSNGR